MKHLRITIQLPESTGVVLRKVVVVFLILLLGFQTNMQVFDLIAEAQENSALEEELKNAAIADLLTVTDPKDLQSALQQTERDKANGSDSSQLDLYQDERFDSSASLFLPPKVVELSKNNYSLNENITVTIANAKMVKFNVQLKDGKGEEVPVQIQEEIIGETKQFTLIPPSSIRPGKFELIIEDSAGGVSEQDFNWGVLAINTNKSIFLPKETAKLALAVLDDTGHMVCDAKVALRITNPDGGMTTLTTEDGGIAVNPSCMVKDITSEPDYESKYEVSGVGKYSMVLAAETVKGIKSISDSFEVRDSVPFDVERSAPTRIYPPKEYGVGMSVKVNEDFKGLITEVVPAEFAVSPKANSLPFKVAKSTERKLLSEDVLGASVSLALPFKGDYPMVSGFGEKHDDHVIQNKYQTFGVVGHDGADFSMPIGTSVRAVDDGEIVMAQNDGDYGTTLVIEHSWGKSYYGHLSAFKVNKGDKVTKGQEVALSGNTGISTGPHLHFGVKPAEHDQENGYYGKVDPLPYLGLKEAKILGATTAKDSDVKLLTWEVDVKKGDILNLGYNFNAPDKSPEFYTLGHLKFFKEGEEIVFSEAREWQIAVDAPGDFVMKTGYYMGNGASQSITGLGFTPELVIIKSDTTAGFAAFKTSIMPSANTGFFSATADSASSVMSLDSDGFTVTGSNVVGSLNVRYTWVAFAGSDCSGTGTFCVGQYTGNGSTTQTVSTGFQPSMVMVKRTTAVAAHFRTASHPANRSSYFTTTADNTAGALIQSFTSSGFVVGQSIDNVNTASYNFIAFKDTTGIFKQGTYTGNGADNTSISGVGFSPDFVIVKNSTSGTTASRSPAISQRSSYGDQSSSLGETTATVIDIIQELESDGFQVGTAARGNESGQTFYYAAFGGAPNPISSGALEMATGTYTGTGGGFSISSLSFKPDLVIIKSNTALQTVFRTSLMHGDITAYLGAATADFAGGITSIDLNGFTIGTNANVNSGGVTYQWQAFGNAFNPVTNSGAADFSIGVYTGNAIDNRDISGLPWQPDYVAIKRNGASATWFKSSSQSGETTGAFSSVAEQASNYIQALNSDGFEVGNPGNDINANVVLYRWFAFKSGSNFAVGNHTGNAIDNTSVSVGFQPDLVWMKRSTAVAGVQRPGTLAGDATQYFVNTANATGRIKSLTSTGYTVGTATEVNASGGIYRWMAFNVPEYPYDVTLYNTDNSDQVAFNNTRQNSSSPLFKASALHSASFNRFQLELNSASDFSGTAYTQTFSGTYSSGTPYTLNANSLSPGLPGTDGVVYYVRMRASDNGGAVWGNWSTGTWTFTYASSGGVNWFQTTDEQFDNDTLLNTQTTGSDSVELISFTGDPSVDFDEGGTDDYFHFGDLASIPDSDTDFTVEMWVKFDSFIGWTEFLSKGSFTGWYMASEASDSNNIAMHFNDTVAVRTKAAASTGVWYYMAATHNAAANTATGYSGTTAGGLDTPINATSVTGPTTTSENFAIGAVPSFTDGCQCQIALVRVWNKELNGTEIGDYWNNHVTETPANLVFNWDSIQEGTGVTAADFINQVTGTSSTAVVGTPTRDSSGPNISSGSTGTVMSTEIEFDSLDGGSAWGEFAWSEDNTNGDVSLQLYHTNTTACDTIVPDSDLPGNSAGFTSGPVNIASLNTSTYDQICLLATLEDSGGTPYLLDWTVSWDGQAPETPSTSQLLRHGAWFNSAGILQPFTF